MPNVLPGITTLAALRALVARKTDQPTPTPFTNVTIPTYDVFINHSLREMVGLLVDSFQDYYVNPDTGNPYLFTTTAQAYLYPQPDDFWKLLGMDCIWSPGQLQTAIRMRPFTQLQRNNWVPLAAGLQILVRYVPVLPDLVDSGEIYIEAIDPGDSITIAALDTLPQGPPVNGVLPELTPQIRYLAVANDQTPVDTDTEVQFQVGETTAEAAANLVAAMNRTAPTPHVPWTTGSYAQDRSVAQVSASGATVTLRLFSALCIVWRTGGASSEYAPGISLTPLPVPSQWNPYGAWMNFSNVLNGFDELVAVDAAIQVKEKQQQDMSGLVRRKDEILARVRSEANNRNAAQNIRVTNVRRGNWRGPGWGFGSGYGGVYGVGTYVPSYKLHGNQIWLQSGTPNGGL